MTKSKQEPLCFAKRQKEQKPSEKCNLTAAATQTMTRQNLENTDRD